MGLEVAGLSFLLSSSFGTLTIGGFSAAQVGGFLLTVALTGAQMAFAARRPKMPGVDNSIKQNVRADIMPQRRVYGEVQTGGAIFFYEAVREWLYVGYAYSVGLCQGITQYKVNGKAFAVDNLYNAINPPFFRPSGAVFLQVSFRNGADDQSRDVLIGNNFPQIPESFRQRGAASAVFRANYGANRDEHDEIYGNGGGFEPLVTLRGARVYDPRDPTQGRDDPSTWKWSRNATLIIADYLRDPKFGRVPADRIDWESVKESAARDAEPVGLKGGGWQPRYCIDGVVDASQAPEEVLRTMLTANRGRVAMTGRKMRILSGGVRREPVMTVHDAVIVGAVECRSAAPRNQLVNRVKTEFIAQDREWSTANGPVYDRPDLQDEDGGIYEQSLQLPFVSSHQHAQRLAKAFMLDARYGRFVTAQVALGVAGCFPVLLEAGDIIRLELTWLPSATGLYTVEKAEFSADFQSIALSLSEFSAEIEDGWIPEEDEQPFEISPATV